jgi:hypothetical protein
MSLTACRRMLQEGRIGTGPRRGRRATALRAAGCVRATVRARFRARARWMQLVRRLGLCVRARVVESRCVVYLSACVYARA